MTRRETPPHRTGAWRTALRRLAGQWRQNLVGVLGALVILAIVLSALAAPALAPHDPTLQDLSLRLQPPGWTEQGTWRYPLGTDQLGRDVLSRIIYGARISLVVGFGSVALALVIGALLGLISGYSGGWLDDVIGRIIDIQLAIPYLLLAVALIMVLGSSLRNLVLVLVLYGWTVYARLMRAQTLSIRQREYVLAARTVGASTPRILFQHILPNAVIPVMVMGTLEVANMIIFEAGLSFLGLGVQPPTPSWGGMLSDGRDYIAAGIWWPATFPGIAISLTVLAINLVGDWMRDRLDPRLGR